MAEPIRIGDFILEKKLGEGGMGQVFKARQVGLERDVALKILPAASAQNEEFKARFYREAQNAAKLIHPNIIQIYTISTYEGIPYFAMEFVEGLDLQQILEGQAEAMPTLPEIVEIIRSVARALAMAAELSIVHRDIKPANIMVSSRGVVKVMDFGLAKATTGMSSLTQTGFIMGTPTYMSPEQGEGKEVDGRSDLYSLGCVFYECLAGRPPFHADGMAALIYKHIYEEPKPLKELRPDVPDAVARIVHRMLAKKPEDRYPDANALLQALDSLDLGPDARNVNLARLGRRRHGASSGGGVSPTEAALDATAMPALGLPRTVQAGAAGASATPAALERTLIAGQAGAGTVGASALREATIATPARAGASDHGPSGQATIVTGAPGAWTPAAAAPPAPKARRTTIFAAAAVALILVTGAAVGIALILGGRDGGTGSGSGAGTPGTPGSAPGRTLTLPLSGLKDILPGVPGARVVQGGIQRDYPFEDVQLPPGKYTIRIEKRGYKPLERDVVLAEGAPPPQWSAADWKLAPKPELDEPYREGVRLMEAGDFEGALREFRRAEDLDPNYLDLAERIRTAVDKQKESLKKVAELIRVGKEAIAARKWDEAVEVLSKVPVEAGRDYQTAQLLLNQANDSRIKLAGFIEGAKDKLRRGDFAGAKVDIESALAVAPPGSEAGEIRKRLDEARDLEARAAKALEGRNYREALDMYRTLRAIAPASDHLARQIKSCEDFLEAEGKAGEMLRGIREAVDKGDSAAAVALINRLPELYRNMPEVAELRKKAEEAVRGEVAAKLLIQADQAITQGNAVALARMLSPEAGDLEADLQRDMDLFKRHEVRIAESKHEVKKREPKGDGGMVLETEWKFRIELPTISRTVEGAASLRITLSPAPGGMLIRSVDLAGRPVAKASGEGASPPGTVLASISAVAGEEATVSAGGERGVSAGRIFLVYREKLTVRVPLYRLGLLATEAPVAALRVTDVSAAESRAVLISGAASDLKPGMPCASLPPRKGTGPLLPVRSVAGETARIGGGLRDGLVEGMKLAAHMPGFLVAMPLSGERIAVPESATPVLTLEVKDVGETECTAVVREGDAKALFAGGFVSLAPPRPPRLLRAAVTQKRVPAGEPVTISFELANPDRQPVSFVWSCSGGILEKKRTASPKNRWFAPAATGTYQVTVAAVTPAGQEARIARPVEVESAGVGTDSRILALEFQGQMGAIPFLAVSDICFDDEDNAYILDPENEGVLKLDEDLTFFQKWSAVEPALCRSRMAAEGDSLYVLDAGTGRILRFRNEKDFASRNPMVEFAAGRGTVDFVVTAAQGVLALNTDAGKVIEYGADGREIRRFGEKGDGGGRMSRPVALAALSLETFVLDAGRNAVLRFLGGRFAGEFPLAGGRDARPVDMEIETTTGNIFVLDAADQTVRGYGRDGSPVPDLKMGGIGKGFGQLFDGSRLASDRAGRLYVIDGAFSRLDCYDAASGTFLGVMKGGGLTGEKKRAVPPVLARVAASPDGAMFAIEHDAKGAGRFIRCISPRGWMSLRIGGGDTFEDIVDVATDREGAVWVLDSKKGLLHFSPRGKALAAPGGAAAGGCDLACSGDTVYVAFSEGPAKAFALDGSEARSRAAPSGARLLAASPEGILYAMDRAGNVTVIRPDGTVAKWPARLDGVSDIEASFGGRIFACDPKRNAIFIYDGATGREVLSVPGPEGCGQVADLATDACGFLYAADIQGRCIVKSLPKTK
ncbi:MAG: protein kinase [Planctomycetota bacterium]|nr:protein kinase [Planctomycetota bacterium]